MADNFDGFSVNLFQDQDGDWLAHLVEMPGISAFANTPAAALAELTIAWEAAKESYRAHNGAGVGQFSFHLLHPPANLYCSQNPGMRG